MTIAGSGAPRLRWEIPDALISGHRPGYTDERGTPVSTADVDAWIAHVQALGARSIICLLADDQLGSYAALPVDLVSYYRRAGFAVAHVPARDLQKPPLTPAHLDQIWEAYQALPKPVLVHCSAGIDRTGVAVAYIRRRLGEAGGRPSASGR